jgi:hypothetical protein
MELNGARILSVDNATDGTVGSDSVVLSRGEFANLLLVKGVLGDTAFYIGGFKVNAGQVPTFVLPEFVDWRVFHGPSDCIFDQNPVEGSTIIHTAAGLAREGMLWTIGGIMAGQFLLQGRIRGTGDLRLSVTLRARVTPPAAVGELRVTAGSGLG